MPWQFDKVKCGTGSFLWETIGYSAGLLWFMQKGNLYSPILRMPQKYQPGPGSRIPGMYWQPLFSSGAW